MKRLFPRVRKSICDCDWMKKFPYEFFMRSILSENLSKYEINHVYMHSFRSIMKGTDSAKIIVQALLFLNLITVTRYFIVFLLILFKPYHVQNSAARLMMTHSLLQPFLGMSRNHPPPLFGKRFSVNSRTKGSEMVF